MRNIGKRWVILVGLVALALTGAWAAQLMHIARDMTNQLHAANQVISTLQVEIHRRDVRMEPGSLHLMDVYERDTPGEYRPVPGVVVHSLLIDKTYQASSEYRRALFSSTMDYNYFTFAKVCDDVLKGQDSLSARCALEHIVNGIKMLNPEDPQIDLVGLLPDAVQGKPEAQSRFEEMRNAVLYGGTWLHRTYFRAYLASCAAKRAQQSDVETIQAPAPSARP